MAGSNLVMIKKLQTAINGRGGKILFKTSQFWSEDRQGPINVYHISQAVWDAEKLRFRHDEIFKSSSLIQVVLFLRDMWYEINGQEVPDDNEYWNEIKSKTSS